MAVWLIVVVVLLVQARRSVDAGIDRLEEARDELSAGDLLSGIGRLALEDAEDELERARSLAANRLLSPLEVVPFVGRQVDSVRDQTTAAVEVVDIGIVAAAEAEFLLDSDTGPGPERVELLGNLEAVVADATNRLADVDLGPFSGLVGPLDDARNRFAKRLSEVKDTLADAGVVTAAFETFFGEPGRYLVLAANNAEMRSGSGMWLSAGVLTVTDGRLELGAMRPTADLVLPEGAVVAPAEMDALWDWLAPTSEWRNLSASPRFDVTAPLALEMWNAATGETLDGVVALDPIALQALLAAQGSIEVDGHELDDDNVLRYIFYDQYHEGDPASYERRERLSAIASATLDALDSRDLETATLVDGLSAAASGRHVLAYAVDPVVQEGWEVAGIEGALDEDSVLVSVLNIGGNKLDQFLAVDADVSVEDEGADGMAVTLQVRMRNDAPRDEPAYVVGPHPNSGVGEGVYDGVVALTVPGDAAALSIDGDPELVAGGPDGPSLVVAVAFQLPRDGRTSFTLHFRLPPGRTLRIEPSGRYPAIEWRFGDRTWSDDHLEAVEL